MHRVVLCREDEYGSWFKDLAAGQVFSFFPTGECYCMKTDNGGYVALATGAYNRLMSADDNPRAYPVPEGSHLSILLNAAKG
jgi:hypothetical protein